MPSDKWAEMMRKARVVCSTDAEAVAYCVRFSNTGQTVEGLGLLVEDFAREREAAATREQAALLRECHRIILEALILIDADDRDSYDNGESDFEALRALLLRLPTSESVMGKQGDSGSVDIPASDSESQEK